MINFSLFYLNFNFFAINLIDFIKFNPNTIFNLKINI